MNRPTLLLLGVPTALTVRASSPQAWSDQRQQHAFVTQWAEDRR
ncbi:hypothetical protein [Pseudomonas sp. microsymbiont 2]